MSYNDDNTTMTTHKNVDTQQLVRLLTTLEAKNPVIDEADVSFFVDPYEVDARTYHDSRHRENMASGILSDDLQRRLSETSAEVAGAIKTVAGLGHDLVYMHADAGQEQVRNGVHEEVWKKVEGLVTVDPDDDFKVTLTEKGAVDPVTNLVASMFGMHDLAIPKPDRTIHVPDQTVHTPDQLVQEIVVPEQTILTPDQKIYRTDLTGVTIERADDSLSGGGANEFISALATAKWLEAKDVPIEHIAGITQNIAGTIPFRPNERTDGYPHDEGYMGVLVERLEKALSEYPAAGAPPLYTPTPEYLEDMTYITVESSNHDVQSFWKEGKENLAQFITVALELDREFNPKFRQSGHTMQDMLGAAGPGYYELIQNRAIDVVVENIPHDYKGFTGQINEAEKTLSHAELVEATKERLAETVEYMKAKKVGIAVTAAIATAIGKKDINLAGFALGNDFRDKRTGEAQATPEEDIILDLLTERGSAVRGYDISHSPAAAFVYEVAGKEAVIGKDGLYEKVADTKSFDTKEQAVAFLNEVAEKTGTDFAVLMEEHAMKSQGMANAINMIPIFAITMLDDPTLNTDLQEKRQSYLDLAENIRVLSEEIRSGQTVDVQDSLLVDLTEHHQRDIKANVPSPAYK